MSSKVKFLNNTHHIAGLTGLIKDDSFVKGIKEKQKRKKVINNEGKQQQSHT